MRFGVGSSYFGTPRSIASDGKRLVIGDYNAKVTFVWSEFPTENGQPPDFTLEIKRQEDEPSVGAMGLALNNNKLYATGSHHVFVWNTFPYSSKSKTRYETWCSKNKRWNVIGSRQNKIVSRHFCFSLWHCYRWKEIDSC